MDACRAGLNRRNQVARLGAECGAFKLRRVMPKQAGRVRWETAGAINCQPIRDGTPDFPSRESRADRNEIQRRPERAGSR